MDEKDLDRAASEEKRELDKKRLKKELSRVWRKRLRNPLLKLFDAGGRVAPFFAKPERTEILKMALEKEPTSIFGLDDRGKPGRESTLDLLSQGLFAKDEMPTLLSRYAGKIEHVYYHGPVMDTAEELFYRIKWPENPRRFVKTHSLSLACKLGAKIRHIHAEGPHRSRLLILDETARLNERLVPYFYPAFKSSAPGMGLSDKYVKIEIKLSLAIAFDSEFSIGKFLSQKHPFYIFVVARDTRQMIHYCRLARSASVRYGERVRVRSINFSSLGIEIPK